MGDPCVLYCDYNATAPLSKRVEKALREGAVSFVNPASLHQMGRYARRAIHQTERFLFETFGLDSKEFRLIFHSGATEGINLVLQGAAKAAQEQGSFSFLYAPTDHACVRNLAPFFTSLGHRCFELPLRPNGDLDVEHTVEFIRNEIRSPETSWLNFTWSQNETGIVWPLDWAIALRQATGINIHVDAVQAPGKLSDWSSLSPELSAYSFSGHKFGALKGIGFSFLHRDAIVEGLFQGGSQQDGLRPGTENTLGAVSLRLALEDLKESFSPELLASAHQEIQDFIEEIMGNKASIVGRQASYRNLNTITLVLNDIKADFLFPSLDLSGLCVGTGSACSSGSLEKSRSLCALGFEDRSHQALRLSFSPFLSREDVGVFKSKFSQAVRPLL